MTRAQREELPHMPRLMRRALRAARRAGLDEPVGRAAYLTNRRWNGDRGLVVRLGAPRTDMAIMRSCRLETAMRWRIHWRAGGSLKAMCWSDRAWRAHRRERAAAIRALVGSLR